MVRGRKPLATSVKDENGAHAKNPQRRNNREPKIKEGMPQPTEIIKQLPLAMTCWSHICEVLDGSRILTPADTHLLEIMSFDYSMSVLLMRQLCNGDLEIVNDKGNVQTKPAANQIHRYLDRRLKACSEVGMTPSSRSRLCVTSEDEEDPMHAYLKIRSAS